MDRKDFFVKTVQYGIASGLMASSTKSNALFSAQLNSEDDTEILKKNYAFLKNWVTDLMNAMYDELDEESRMKLFEACGKGCYNRHQFKQDIAAKGKDSLENLIKAYDQNFEIWKEGEDIHIRYGKISKGCYCPVGKNMPNRPNDSHCECTKATHKTIFENALGKPVQIRILETVKRGGKTCHFVVNI